MPELLDIKCARIWAFDEMIDTNTYHDGLSTRLSIQQLKYTLNMIICKKDTMTEYIDYRDINNDYLDILRKLLIYNNYDRTSILDTINMNPFETVYYSCGWSEHAITIFITNNGDWDEDLGNWNYELGIINCGQGAEFQGCNDISCNGLIIFRNLSYKKIQDFLIMYSTYCTVTEELKYPNFMIYRSFYLLLFNTILGEDIVDFKKPNNNIKFYKIPLQTIGSCFFTNTVIIVYYLYIKKYPGLRDNETYELYSTWYNAMKIYIKEMMYDEILQEPDTIKYLKYYNIYKYISDINFVKLPNSESSSTYEVNNLKIYIKNLSPVVIDVVNYDYTILASDPVLNTYTRDSEDKYKFYDLYDNKITFEHIYLEWKDKDNYSNIDLLQDLFIFFENIPLFNNNMKLLVPLLILYKFKKTATNIDLSFWETLTSPEILNILKSETTEGYSYPDYISNEEHITICIYILLVNDINNLNNNKLYYNIKNNSKRQKDNFDFYNKYIFQYIPIINDYYLEIVKILINDLYNNIGILPDINNNTHYKDCKIIYKNNENKYYIKCLNDFYSSNKNFITQQFSRSANFLLWYIFIHSISNERLYSTPTSIYYEVYGCIDYLPSSRQDSLHFIIHNDNTYNSINNYSGTNTLHDQIIKVFSPYIKKKLEDYNIETKFLLPEILKLYIIYFYCSYLKKTNKQDIIDNNSIMYNKFNTLAIEYFKDIYYDPFKTIIDTYIDIYDLTFSSEKKKLIINEKILISNIEKKYFTVKEYSYTECENLCSSIIKFYCIHTTDYTLVFPSDSINTPDSIRIIKDLLNLNVSIYLLLNFSFNEKDGIITGIYKYNNNNKLTCNISDYKLIYNEGEEKYICLSAIDLPHTRYLNFYNLMSHNDNGLFLYKHERDEIYYLRSFRYEFIFIMKNENVYITTGNIEYMVNWYNDGDNYNIYGILKLYKVNKNKVRKGEIIETIETIETIDSKIICIYNYDIIIRLINNNILCMGCDYDAAAINKCKDFIDNTFKSSESNIFKNLKDLPDEYKVYQYTILNKYNNKYILTNISDVLALLINCLYYNSPFLILKNIEQIKVILNNNDYDKDNLNRFLNTLFLNFDNIYSLPILFLFYENEKNIGNFYYESSNIIYKHYKILLSLEIDSSEVEFQYSKITVDLYDLDNHDISPIYPRTKKNFLYFNYITDDTTATNDSDSKITIYFSIFEDDSDEGFHYSLTISDTIILSMVKKCKLLIQNEENTTSKDNFKTLANLFCPNFCNTKCEENISKAIELYDYLIIETKTFIHPIQEILMGSGKSTVLTSYICILLLKYFLLNKFTKKEIYIVMPIPLINASFETLMKFVFPLFNNIEVLIYPNLPLYSTSTHLYLINDMNYKIMFLKEPINTDDKYMIYDEVDMMANPLTCELNIPLDKDILPFDDLFIIADKLYTNIFDEASTFWENIDKKNKLDSHNYIYEIDDTNREQIIDKFNKIFPEYDSDPIITYIKDNILIFILTKQFNLDYGMPENYNLDSTTIYKFKAIPYSAVDSPVMGSEFSDPILTYILTLFCYKFVKGKYRKIDKDYILEYYDNLYLQNKNDEIIFKLLADLFIDNGTRFEYTKYKKHKDYYMSIYTDIFNITDHFNIIIKKILEMNNTYYKTCKNISFTALLLSRNVKNFICFTGTAYIEPPKGTSKKDINFKKNKEITFYKNKKKTVIESIESIITDNDIMMHMYNNQCSQNLINNIFKCLYSYDVLIDIGGVFTNYNICKFIETYKAAIETYKAVYEAHKQANKTHIDTPTYKDAARTNNTIVEYVHASNNTPPIFKKYIVYFDNGRKIYNLETNQFETNKSINQTEKNTFFYFSNKDITGVDVKDIMHFQAHALVVITNKTNMRDFSQGIFRMRRLLDIVHETFDIVFDNKFYNIINPSDIQHNRPEFHDCFYKLTDTVVVRQNIIKNLNKQQDEITEQKKLSLLKQNIFGLTRKTNTETKIYLFLYPGSTKYTELYNESEYDTGDIKINNINIDKINIFFIRYTKVTPSIFKLIETYFKLSDSFKNMGNSTIHTTSELEISTETITESTTTQLRFTDTKRTMNKGTIFLNFKYCDTWNKQHNDNILCLHISTTVKDFLSIYDNYALYDILLVYSWTYNNLIILNTYQLILFLTNTINVDEEYTFISLCDLTVYGKNMHLDKKSYLLSKFLYILENNITIATHHSKHIDGDNDINKSELVQALKKLILYLSINITDVKSNNGTETNSIRYSSKYSSSENYLIKYMKYKDKYLNLIKNNL